MAGGIGGRIERGFLALVLTLALGACAAVLLADVGFLEPAPFTAAAVAAAILASLAARRIDPARRPVEPSDAAAVDAAEVTGDGSRRALAAAAILVLCAVIFFPPYETFLWASDSSVYLGLGAEIARNDGFELHDPLLAEIEAPAGAEIFRNWTRLDATGAHVRLPGGFAIPDIAEPAVVAGFSPVFPALLAVVYDVFGARAMPWVAPVFATLAMLALLFVGCRLGGTIAGVGAAVLAAVSMPQIWFARFPMPEIVAELFVLTALLALSHALAHDQPLTGAMAGLLLGVAALGKLELAPIVAVTLATFLGGRMLATGTRPSRIYMWTTGVFAMLVAYMVLHYLLLPTHYTFFIRQQVSTNYVARTIQSFGWGRFAAVAALAGTVTVIALLRLNRELRARLFQPRGWGAAMLLAVGAYFLNDTAPPNVVNNPVGMKAGLEETVGWLGWYLPSPFGLTLVVASVGATLFSWHRWQGQRGQPHSPRAGGSAHRETAESTRDDRNDAFAANTSAARETLAFVAVLALVACLHLYRAPDTDEHIWRMRWFVPVVVPSLTLLTATLSAIVLRRLWPRRGALLTAAALAGLATVVALPSRPILGQPLWEGAFRAGDEIAALVPEGAIVLMSVDLAGTHLATALNYIHDVRAIVLQPGPITILGDLITGWIESDRPVFVITGERIFSFYAPALSLAEIDRRVLALPVLERTTGRRPRRIVSEEARITIGRFVARREAPTLIDIGNPADDTFFQLFGFHGEELDAGRDEERFRWTSASARLVIPPADQVRLRLSGARPEGVPAARLSVSIDGVLILEDLDISNEPMDVVIDLPAPQGATLPAGPGASATVPESTGGRNLVLISTTFRPAQGGASTDERRLGVRLYSVELIDSQGRGDERDQR